jgi:hypothetical protein
MTTEDFADNRLTNGSRAPDHQKAGAGNPVGKLFFVMRKI